MSDLPDLELEDGPLYRYGRKSKKAEIAQLRAERDAAREEAKKAISRSFAVRAERDAALAEIKRMQGLLNRLDTDYSVLDEKYDALMAQLRKVGKNHV